VTESFRLLFFSRRDGGKRQIQLGLAQFSASFWRGCLAARREGGRRKRKKRDKGKKRKKDKRKGGSEMEARDSKHYKKQITNDAIFFVNNEE
jgi:hypothetical protein